MPAWKQRIFCMLWLVMAPLSLLLAYRLDPPRHLVLPDLLAVAVVYAVTALFSFRVGHIDIVMLQGIGLAAFLIFGLFIDMLLTQMAVVIYFLSKFPRRRDDCRFLIQLLMFLLLSFAAGLTYYLLGGKISRQTTFFSDNFVPIFGFYVSSYLMNAIYLFCYHRFLLGEKQARFFSVDARWVLLAIVLMMPMGMAFYAMYFQAGLLGMGLIAVPMAISSLLLRMYNTSREVSFFFERLNVVGQKLTAELDGEQIPPLLFRELSAVMPVDFGYIVLFARANHPEVIYRYQTAGTQAFVPFERPTDLSFDGFRAGRPSYGHRSSVVYPFLRRLSNRKARSFISVPMFYRKRVVGVLTVAAAHAFSYRKSHRIGMELLGNFLATALGNARSFEEKRQESEHCPLTGLYNYRYFMTGLHRQIEQQPDTIVSLLLLDVDNFKHVNDVYGHQNGNAVLVGMADCLRATVDRYGTVSRYGGEEFTITLPDMPASRALLLAEAIRRSVASREFLVYIADQKDYETIHVTVSIGVAAYPHYAVTAGELVYKADEAMYGGAKQKGKNRVSLSH
ncbi:MAG: sensor domain-containing diguanylate cyclase [Sporolactobacillus sp.]